jgi:hypothetical protein
VGLTGRRLLRVAALLSAMPVLASCADCFFKVDGKLTDCGTSTALAGAAITVRIDQGMHGVRTLSQTFTTDGAGLFAVHTDATETCSAWATLMFRKDGYMPLDSQYQGAPKRLVGVCMTPIAAAP